MSLSTGEHGASRSGRAVTRPDETRKWATVPCRALRTSFTTYSRATEQVFESDAYTYYFSGAGSAKVCVLRCACSCICGRKDTYLRSATSQADESFAPRTPFWKFDPSGRRMPNLPAADSRAIMANGDASSRTPARWATTTAVESPLVSESPARWACHRRRRRAWRGALRIVGRLNVRPLQE